MGIVLLTLSQVRNAADRFLVEYNHDGILPIPIEDIAELKLNIFVCAIPGIKNLIGIDGFITSDFTQITIDEYCYTKFVERTRFTIAHEIGHKILHQEWYMKNGPKDFDSHQDYFSKISEQDYRYMEIQAQTFAGFVLIPTDLLNRELINKLGKMPANEDLEIIQPVFNDLLGIFKVSGEVMVRRMIKEGIIKKI